MSVPTLIVVTDIRRLPMFRDKETIEYAHLFFLAHHRKQNENPGEYMVPNRSRRTASRVITRDDLSAELGMSGGLQVTHDIRFRDRHTSLSTT